MTVQQISFPSLTPKETLPASDALQSAFHEAFRDELYRIIDELPITPDAHVLDVPCGDGFYSLRLAARLDGGPLTLADGSPAYLDAARDRLASWVNRTPIDIVKADVYDLPFPDESFDLVWCAQSLLTFDDPGAALAEMVRVTRPRGTVALLESDEFHHLLLPWPIDLELAVQRALDEARQARHGKRGRLAPGRQVRRLLLDMGLRSPRKYSFTGDRHAPFSPDVRLFLERHLAHLNEFITGHLRAPERIAFKEFITPGQPGNIFDRPDLELTCLNVVYLARKPAFTRPAWRRRDRGI